jgi:hypothetical protein
MNTLQKKHIDLIRHDKGSFDAEGVGPCYGPIRPSNRTKSRPAPSTDREQRRKILQFQTMRQMEMECWS